MFDRVLIERAEALTKTRGGIVIPEKAQQKVLKGTVVAVGPGARTEVLHFSSFIYCFNILMLHVFFHFKRGDVIPVAVKVGDQVLLPEYGGTKVEIEEKEYHLFRENDLLAKIDP